MALSRFEIISKADKDLLSNIKEIESESFEKLIEFLNSQFDLSGGKFIGGNFDEINRVASLLRSEILKTGYQENVINYVTNFDTLRKITENTSKFSTANLGLNNIQRAAQQQTINSMLGSGLDANIVEPVKKIIFDHVQSGSSIVDAELMLRDLILGNDEKLGKLERYVGQIARDSISQFDGLMQQRIMKEYDLDGWSYEGSLIKDSRPQCVRWATMGEIKVSELANEIDWANSNGSGMITGTTVDTFGIYRGGYNCRHFATAIRL